MCMEEVRNALFDIDIDKARGTDEFGSFFFKSFWNIVGNDVFDDVHEIFLVGDFSSNGTTVIALVPKFAESSPII